ncbi:MAG: response regulator [Candidatus Nitrohelix vancouverensis]|uniref:histidine kinase n=1 Tax=Candidatus Nitrohelix vancouverensis TaxID=2705534 RepID=A0A7T0C213_9BACT|nr:MAG: response regulator [Candidatus Nitrohelix vancouverensis]
MKNDQKKILVVDDEPANIDLLVRTLKEDDYTVIAATDGEKALELVKKTKPNLILLDVILPQMDGYEVCKTLKTSPDSNDIPIIFTTSLNDPENIKKGFSMGCDEYISKPFSSVEVRNRVRTHLSLRDNISRVRLLYSEIKTDLSKAKVLIVDDIATNIDIVKEILRQEKVDILAAPSATIAQKLVERTLPDLILLDIMMPGLNGFEFCEWLKQRPETQNIPVIFISALNSPEYIARGFSLGCVDYIAKPFHDKEVLSRVHSHLVIRKLHKQMDEWNRQLEKSKAELEGLVSERTQHLEQAIETANRASQTKSEFLAKMSHELRTPMNAVLGFTQVLEMESETLSESQQVTVQHIHDAADHLLKLIDDVLDFGKMESGQIPMVIQKIDVKETINESIIPMILPSAEKKKLRIENRLEKMEGACWVKCDRNRLIQILINLATNGVKYNKDGGDLIFDYEATDDGRATITVTDCGPGIPQDKIETIFHPFYRLPENNVAIPGVGIGLAIVKRFLELMGGDIQVTSEKDKGSTFSITLPIE